VRKKVSASFFGKKEAKRLLLNWATGAETCTDKGKSFLVLFFKKELLNPFTWSSRRRGNPHVENYAGLLRRLRRLAMTSYGALAMISKSGRISFAF
jgi:hypothetical protein